MAGDQAGRVDSWIWSVRLAKTRSAASVACRAGHVRVNGVRVKPAHAVRAGDEVRLRGEGRERVVIVRQVITKRVSASAWVVLPDPGQPATSTYQRRAGWYRPLGIVTVCSLPSKALPTQTAPDDRGGDEIVAFTAGCSYGSWHPLIRS